MSEMNRSDLSGSCKLVSQCLVVVTAALLLTFVHSPAAIARQSKDANTGPRITFVQVAETIKVDENAKTLRLVNVGKQTLYFSDRPVRLAGQVGIADYLAEWSSKAGKNSFGADPPNATLSVVEPGKPDDTLVVVKLSSPVVDGADLVYTYKLIDGTMPKGGGAAALFIDGIGLFKFHQHKLNPT